MTNLRGARGRHIATFLALAFGGSWAIEIGLYFSPLPLMERFAIAAPTAMFAPGIAAFVVRGPLFHEGFADAGLALHWRASWRVYLAAYVCVPLLVLASIGVALMTGLQHWVFPPQIVAPGFTRIIPVEALLPIALASLTVALPINMLFTFGEEFGWRGYLLPKLAPVGRVWSAVLVGVVWGLWHAPLIALYGFNYPGHPLSGIVMMTAFAVAFGVLQGWLRYASGSIWPAVLAHAAMNAQAGLGLIFLTPADSLLRASLGVSSVVPFAAVALWLVVGKHVAFRSTADHEARKFEAA